LSSISYVETVVKIRSERAGFSRTLRTINVEKRLDIRKENIDLEADITVR